MRRIYAALVGLLAILCVASIAQPQLSAPGGLNVMIDGRPAGSFSSVAFTSGNGINWTATPSGQTLNIAAAVNTATQVNKTSLQSGACTYLRSTNGTKAYTVSLGLTCQALTSYTAGQGFWLTTDAPCPVDCSINIDNVGIKNITLSDGGTNPGGQFDFTQGVPIRYDGTVFRIEWQR